MCVMTLATGNAMPASRSAIATADGNRLVKRLLAHWGHKFEVGFDADRGHVAFDAETRARFHALPDTLEVRIDAADPERLARMQQVVADHLQRMARGETLRIDWQAA